MALQIAWTSKYPPLVKYVNGFGQTEAAIPVSGLQRDLLSYPAALPLRGMGEDGESNSSSVNHLSLTERTQACSAIATKTSRSNSK